MTLAEYVDALDAQTASMSELEKQQDGVHQEADLYRTALEKLETAQAGVDRSTEEGQEAYNKLGSEIETVKGKITDLQQEWLRLEGLQRSNYSEYVGEMVTWMDRMVELEILSKEEELQKLATFDLQNLTISEQYETVQKMKDLSQAYVDDIIGKRIEALEKERDLAKEASENRIASLQREIDLMNEENEAAEQQKSIQESLERISEARADLADAKTKLSNVQNERNTRIFQNGTWDYIADPQAVRDAQKEVESAQDKLKEAKQAYYDEMAEIDRKEREKELQAQIEAEKLKQEETDKAYDDKIKALEELGRQMLTAYIQNNTALIDQTKTDLQALGITFDKNLEPILTKIQVWAAAAKAEIQSVIELGSENGAPLPGMASGGRIPVDMAIQAHAGEYMFNAKDVSLMGGYSGVERFLAALRFGGISSKNISGTNSSSSTTYDRSIGQLSLNLPNIHDVSGLSRYLKQLAAS